MSKVGLVSMIFLAALVQVSVAAALHTTESSKSALARDLAENLKERPVMKVVRMLQDMKAELEKELEDDKAVHELLHCWCKTNREEKTQAIEVGEQTVAELESSLSADAAKVVELKTQRKATQDQMWADQKALGEATELRMKENQAFHDDEVNLLGAIDACKQAIVVLKKHNPSLAQLKSVAHMLEAAKVSDLILSTRGSGRIGVLTLKDFVKNAQSATSFLAIPGFQSYAPQSGQIFGILQQMQEDFEADVSEAQKAEQKAEEEYQSLKAAKEEEIASAQKLMTTLDGEIADLGEKAALEAKELKDTQEQLAMDKEFLANLEKKCAESAEEFDTRVKARLEEIAAVEDTIKILNDDTAFNVFEKTVNTNTPAPENTLGFLQVSSSQQEKAIRQKAAAVLRKAAGRFGLPQLALLATAAQLDAFTTVKAEIDKLVAELSQQQKDEVAHRDWCIDDMAANKRETAAASDKLENLKTKEADLEQEIKSLTESIEAETKAIAEMQTQMKRRSETREAENADYQETITDNVLTQAILQKALERMQMVYAMLQQQPGAPHIQTSGTHTDPGNGPAAFKEYEKNAGGKRVVAMIEEVIADSKKMQDEAEYAEQSAQEAYEDFMKDSNKLIIAGTKKINDETEAKAKASESLTMTKTDIKQTIMDLEGLNGVLGDLHKSCDYILKNFDVRQAARAAEINALQEAKAILSGMK